MPDAVSVAPNDGAEVGLVVHIAVDGIVTEDDIGQFAVAIRHLERDDRSAIVSDGNFRPAFIREHIKIDGLAVRSYPEVLRRGVTRLRFSARLCENRHK